MKRVFKILLWVVIPLFVLLNVILAFHAYKFTHYYDPEASESLHNNKSISLKEILFGMHFTRKPDGILPDTSYETVYLSENGLKLQGWMIRVANPKGTFAMFHGHGGNKSDILEEAKQFRRLGYNTFLIDFRAHGNSEGHTCTIGFKEADDVELAYKFIKNAGEAHIYLWGISLGAAAITRAISIDHLQPEKVILELPFGSLLQAVKGRVRLMHLPEQPTATMLTFWGGLENGFWAFSIRPSEYVKDIHCPVLLEFAALDKRVSLSEANEIYNNISAPKKMVIYELAGHESLCKKEPVKWSNEISEFMTQ